jgi:hypothetical protein
MKKALLLFVSVMSVTIGLRAQCTIQQSCTPSGGYCSTPAANSSLPNANELTPYNSVIQITLASSWAGNTINSGTLTSVTGLPAGLSYSSNPTNGVISGGGSGCILLTGTPATGSAGSYTVTANMSLNTMFGLIPGTLKWTLTVLGTTGITEGITGNNGTAIIAPNPVKNIINIMADFYFTQVTLFDAQGKEITIQKMSDTDNGSIDVSHISQGLYFLHISDGTNSVVRKFIKD